MRFGCFVRLLISAREGRPSLVDFEDRAPHGFGRDFAAAVWVANELVKHQERLSQLQHGCHNDEHGRETGMTLG